MGSSFLLLLDLDFSAQRGDDGNGFVFDPAIHIVNFVKKLHTGTTAEILLCS